MAEVAAGIFIVLCAMWLTIVLVLICVMWRDKF